MSKKSSVDQLTLDLFVPDRFDVLQHRAKDQLNSIVVEVGSGIETIEEIHADMTAAGRGGFLILHGISGCGKSTFLNTLGLFLDRTEVFSISREDSIEETLRALKPTEALFRVIILEGRDALRDVDDAVLESAIHEINSFIRTPKGTKTLVVWPVNAANLEQKLINTSRRVGGDSLLGVRNPSFRFSGPPKDQYLEIANRTITTLNEGAHLADLGVAETQVPHLIAKSETIGSFLSLLRGEMLQNKKHIEALIKKEKCRLWIVVIAGNDIEGDVLGLTRGTISAVDTDRLLRATNANIVKELKEYPEKLGILGAVLDAKIIRLSTVAALAITKTFANEKLSAAMAAQGLKLSGNKDGLERIIDSDLGKAFTGDTMRTRTRGSKVGTNTVSAFQKLAAIATTNDGILNAAIGEALKQAGLIDEFETEKDLGSGLVRLTDILCRSGNQVIRLEIMWRSTTGRAAIANYALTKLYNYGKAIEYLK